jgi:hypothetical protein
LRKPVATAIMMATIAIMRSRITARISFFPLVRFLAPERRSDDVHQRRRLSFGCRSAARRNVDAQRPSG